MQSRTKDVIFSRYLKTFSLITHCDCDVTDAKTFLNFCLKCDSLQNRQKQQK